MRAIPRNRILCTCLLTLATLDDGTPLQETREPRPYPFLSLSEFRCFGLLVQDVQRVGVTLLLQVLLDLAELLAELSVQHLGTPRCKQQRLIMLEGPYSHLVVQNVLEVFPRR